MKVILYDGECGFCASSVRFVWKRDREGIFHFAPIQSERGAALLRDHGVPDPKLDTFYLLDGDRLDDRSEAALRVCRQLPRYRLLANLGLLVPRFLRDRVYDFIAKNRRRLSRHATCELPPPEVRNRFLDGNG